MKRLCIVSTLLYAAVLAFSLGVAAQRVKLVFWHIYGPGSPQHDLIEKAVAEFNRLHRGSIEVEAQVQDF